MTARKNACGLPEYGACRCCSRWFTAHPVDRVTEARHEKNGYCAGCAKSAERAGTETPQCVHGPVPAAEYRCGFTTEENIIHLERFLLRIHGASDRISA